MKYFLIIPASGSGSRFGLKTPKQFYKIEGKEIIVHTLQRFNSFREIDSIYVSVQKEYLSIVNNLVSRFRINKVRNILIGGRLRQDSVFNALRCINAKKGDRIIVHDAVRPFVSKNLMKNLIKESPKYDCVIPALKLTDTIKMTDKKGIVISTVPRENLWSVQTPQVFEYSKLLKAFSISNNDSYIGTDEAALMEYAGYKVKIIEGDKENIKITTKEDIK